MATRINCLYFITLLWFTKLFSLLIKLFKVGQASNFPGKIALKFKKDLLQHFKISKDTKIILVTGTNGKSTTCGLLANILKTSGRKVIYNKSGANLLTGIASCFCNYSDLFGNLKYNYIVLEIDEATLPILTNQIVPNAIAVTNFFRDQLDRFGELDSMVKLIEKGIYNSKNSTLILNADDPRVAFLKSENKKVFYGFDCGRNETNNKINDFQWLKDPEENTICKNCNSNLVYIQKTSAHLGNYKCTKCGLTRPQIDFLISGFKTDDQTTNFNVIFNNHKNNFFLPLIGTFNLYNALCAITIAKTISDVTNVQIQKSFQTYSTIFGRGEKITLNNKIAWIYLIKNPAGATEVLKVLCSNPNARFLIALNDNLADGRDVSWIWDARFDILSSHKKEIFVSGKRALDMAVRLEYANFQPEKIKVNEKITSAINNAVESLENNETLYILPTYTVLLEMQRKGIVKTC